jgi:hypothetical protein
MIPTKPSSQNFVVGFAYGDSDMTTRKRLLLIAAMPLAIAVTVGVLAMLPPRPGVTKANFDRIEKGMTRVEVEAIFRRVFQDMVEGDKAFLQADDGSETWIRFQGDCVDEKGWHDWHETFLDKIRRWLHLR